MYKLICSNLSKSNRSLTNFNSTYKKVTKNFSYHKHLSLSHKKFASDSDVRNVEKSLENSDQLNESIEEESEKDLSEVKAKSYNSFFSKITGMTFPTRPLLGFERSPSIRIVMFSTNRSKYFYSSIINQTKTPSGPTNKKTFKNKEALEMYKSALEQCMKIKFNKYKIEKMHKKVTWIPSPVQADHPDLVPSNKTVQPVVVYELPVVEKIVSTPKGLMKIQRHTKKSLLKPNTFLTVVEDENPTNEQVAIKPDLNTSSLSDIVLEKANKYQFKTSKHKIMYPTYTIKHKLTTTKRYSIKQGESAFRASHEASETRSDNSQSRSSRLGSRNKFELGGHSAEYVPIDSEKLTFLREAIAYKKNSPAEKPKETNVKKDPLDIDESTKIAILTIDKIRKKHDKRTSFKRYDSSNFETPSSIPVKKSEKQQKDKQMTAKVVANSQTVRAALIGQHPTIETASKAVKMTINSTYNTILFKRLQEIEKKKLAATANIDPDLPEKVSWAKIPVQDENHQETIVPAKIKPKRSLSEPYIIEHPVINATTEITSNVTPKYHKNILVGKLPTFDIDEMCIKTNEKVASNQFGLVAGKQRHAVKLKSEEDFRKMSRQRIEEDIKKYQGRQIEMKKDTIKPAAQTSMDYFKKVTAKYNFRDKESVKKAQEDIRHIEKSFVDGLTAYLKKLKEMKERTVFDRSILESYEKKVDIIRKLEVGELTQQKEHKENIPRQCISDDVQKKELPDIEEAATDLAYKKIKSLAQRQVNRSSTDDATRDVEVLDKVIKPSFDKRPKKASTEESNKAPAVKIRPKTAPILISKGTDGTKKESTDFTFSFEKLLVSENKETTLKAVNNTKGSVKKNKEVDNQKIIYQRSKTAPTPIKATNVRKGTQAEDTYLELVEKSTTSENKKTAVEVGNLMEDAVRKQRRETNLKKIMSQYRIKSIAKKLASEPNIIQTKLTNPGMKWLRERPQKNQGKIKKGIEKRDTPTVVKRVITVKGKHTDIDVHQKDKQSILKEESSKSPETSSSRPLTGPEGKDDTLLENRIIIRKEKPRPQSQEKKEKPKSKKDIVLPSRSQQLSINQDIIKKESPDGLDKGEVDAKSRKISSAVITKKESPSVDRKNVLGESVLTKFDRKNSKNYPEVIKSDAELKSKKGDIEKKAKSEVEKKNKTETSEEAAKSVGLTSNRKGSSEINANKQVKGKYSKESLQTQVKCETGLENKKGYSEENPIGVPTNNEECAYIIIKTDGKERDSGEKLPKVPIKSDFEIRNKTGYYEIKSAKAEAESKNKTISPLTVGVKSNASNTVASTEVTVKNKVKEEKNYKDYFKLKAKSEAIMIKTKSPSEEEAEAQVKTNNKTDYTDVMAKGKATEVMVKNENTQPVVLSPPDETWISTEHFAESAFDTNQKRGSSEGSPKSPSTNNALPRKYSKTNGDNNNNPPKKKPKHLFGELKKTKSDTDRRLKLKQEDKELVDVVEAVQKMLKVPIILPKKINELKATARNLVRESENEDVAKSNPINLDSNEMRGDNETKAAQPLLSAENSDKKVKNDVADCMNKQPEYDMQGSSQSIMQAATQRLVEAIKNLTNFSKNIEPNENQVSLDITEENVPKKQNIAKNPTINLAELFDGVEESVVNKKNALNNPGQEMIAANKREHCSVPVLEQFNVRKHTQNVKSEKLSQVEIKSPKVHMIKPVVLKKAADPAIRPVDKRTSIDGKESVGDDTKTLTDLQKLKSRSSVEIKESKWDKKVKEVKSVAWRSPKKKSKNLNTILVVDKNNTSDAEKAKYVSASKPEKKIQSISRDTNLSNKLSDKSLAKYPEKAKTVVASNTEDGGKKIESNTSEKNLSKNLPDKAIDEVKIKISKIKENKKFPRSSKDMNLPNKPSDTILAEDSANTKNVFASKTEEDKKIQGSLSEKNLYNKTSKPSDKTLTEDRQKSTIVVTSKTERGRNTQSSSEDVNLSNKPSDKILAADPGNIRNAISSKIEEEKIQINSKDKDLTNKLNKLSDKTLPDDLQKTTILVPSKIEKGTNVKSSLEDMNLFNKPSDGILAENPEKTRTVIPSKIDEDKKSPSSSKDKKLTNKANKVSDKILAEDHQKTTILVTSKIENGKNIQRSSEDMNLSKKPFDKILSKDSKNTRNATPSQIEEEKKVQSNSKDRNLTKKLSDKILSEDHENTTVLASSKTEQDKNIESTSEDMNLSKKHSDTILAEDPQKTRNAIVSKVDEEKKIRSSSKEKSLTNKSNKLSDKTPAEDLQKTILVSSKIEKSKYIESKSEDVNLSNKPPDKIHAEDIENSRNLIKSKIEEGKKVQVRLKYKNVPNKRHHKTLDEDPENNNIVVTSKIKRKKIQSNSEDTNLSNKLSDKILTDPDKTEKTEIGIESNLQGGKKTQSSSQEANVSKKPFEKILTEDPGNNETGSTPENYTSPQIETSKEISIDTTVKETENTNNVPLKPLVELKSQKSCIETIDQDVEKTKNVAASKVENEEMIPRCLEAKITKKPSVEIVVKHDRSKIGIKPKIYFESTIESTCDNKSEQAKDSSPSKKVEQFGNITHGNEPMPLKLKSHAKESQLCQIGKPNDSVGTSEIGVKKPTTQGRSSTHLIKEVPTPSPGLSLQSTKMESRDEKLPAEKSQQHKQKSNLSNSSKEAVALVTDDCKLQEKEVHKTLIKKSPNNIPATTGSTEESFGEKKLKVTKLAETTEEVQKLPSKMEKPKKQEICLKEHINELTKSQTKIKDPNKQNFQKMSEHDENSSEQGTQSHIANFTHTNESKENPNFPLAENKKEELGYRTIQSAVKSRYPKITSEMRFKTAKKAYFDQVAKALLHRPRLSTKKYRGNVDKSRNIQNLKRKDTGEIWIENASKEGRVEQIAGKEGTVQTLLKNKINITEENYVVLETKRSMPELVAQLENIEKPKGKTPNAGKITNKVIIKLSRDPNMLGQKITNKSSPDVPAENLTKPDKTLTDTFKSSKTSHTQHSNLKTPGGGQLDTPMLSFKEMLHVQLSRKFELGPSGITTIFVVKSKDKNMPPINDVKKGILTDTTKNHIDDRKTRKPSSKTETKEHGERSNKLEVREKLPNLKLESTSQQETAYNKNISPKLPQTRKRKINDENLEELKAAVSTSKQKEEVHKQKKIKPNKEDGKTIENLQEGAKQNSAEEIEYKMFGRKRAGYEVEDKAKQLDELTGLKYCRHQIRVPNNLKKPKLKDCKETAYTEQFVNSKVETLGGVTPKNIEGIIEVNPEKTDQKLVGSLKTDSLKDALKAEFVQKLEKNKQIKQENSAEEPREKISSSNSEINKMTMQTISERSDKAAEQKLKSCPGRSAENMKIKRGKSVEISENKTNKEKLLENSTNKTFKKLTKISGNKSVENLKIEKSVGIAEKNIKKLANIITETKEIKPETCLKPLENSTGLDKPMKNKMMGLDISAETIVEKEPCSITKCAEKNETKPQIYLQPAENLPSLDKEQNNVISIDKSAKKISERKSGRIHKSANIKETKMGFRIKTPAEHQTNFHKSENSKVSNQDKSVENMINNKKNSIAKHSGTRKTLSSEKNIEKKVASSTNYTEIKATTPKIGFTKSEYENLLCLDKHGQNNTAKGDKLAQKIIGTGNFSITLCAERSKSNPEDCSSKPIENLPTSYSPAQNKIKIRDTSPEKIITANIGDKETTTEISIQKPVESSTGLKKPDQNKVTDPVKASEKIIGEGTFHITLHTEMQETEPKSCVPKPTISIPKSAQNLRNARESGHNKRTNNDITAEKKTVSNTKCTEIKQTKTGTSAPIHFEENLINLDKSDSRASSVDQAPKTFKDEKTSSFIKCSEVRESKPDKCLPKPVEHQASFKDSEENNVVKLVKFVEKVMVGKGLCPITNGAETKETKQDIFALKPSDKQAGVDKPGQNKVTNIFNITICADKNEIKPAICALKPGEKLASLEKPIQNMDTNIDKPAEKIIENTSDNITKCKNIKETKTEISPPNPVENRASLKKTKQNKVINLDKPAEKIIDTTKCEIKETAEIFTAKPVENSLIKPVNNTLTTVDKSVGKKYIVVEKKIGSIIQETTNVSLGKPAKNKAINVDKAAEKIIDKEACCIPKCGEMKESKPEIRLLKPCEKLEKLDKPVQNMVTDIGKSAGKVIEKTGDSITKCAGIKEISTGISVSKPVEENLTSLKKPEKNKVINLNKPAEELLDKATHDKSKGEIKETKPEICIEKPVENYYKPVQNTLTKINKSAGLKYIIVEKKIGSIIKASKTGIFGFKPLENLVRLEKTDKNKVKNLGKSAQDKAACSITKCVGKKESKPKICAAQPVENVPNLDKPDQYKIMNIDKPSGKTTEKNMINITKSADMKEKEIKMSAAKPVENLINLENPEKTPVANLDKSAEKTVGKGACRITKCTEILGTKPEIFNPKPAENLTGLGKPGQNKVKHKTEMIFTKKLGRNDIVTADLTSSEQLGNKVMNVTSSDTTDHLKSEQSKVKTLSSPKSTGQEAVETLSHNKMANKQLTSQTAKHSYVEQLKINFKSDEIIKELKAALADLKPLDRLGLYMKKDTEDRNSEKSTGKIVVKASNSHEGLKNETKAETCVPKHTEQHSERLRKDVNFEKIKPVRKAANSKGGKTADRGEIKAEIAGLDKCKEKTVKQVVTGLYRKILKETAGEEVRSTLSNKEEIKRTKKEKKESNQEKMTAECKENTSVLDRNEDIKKTESELHLQKLTESVIKIMNKVEESGKNTEINTIKYDSRTFIKVPSTIVNQKVNKSEAKNYELAATRPSTEGLSGQSEKFKKGTKSEKSQDNSIEDMLDVNFQKLLIKSGKTGAQELKKYAPNTVMTRAKSLCKSETVNESLQGNLKANSETGPSTATDQQTKRETYSKVYRDDSKSLYLVSKQDRNAHCKNNSVSRVGSDQEKNASNSRSSGKKNKYISEMDNQLDIGFPQNSSFNKNSLNKSGDVLNFNHNLPKPGNNLSKDALQDIHNSPIIEHKMNLTINKTNLQLIKMANKRKRKALLRKTKKSNKTAIKIDENLINLAGKQEHVEQENSKKSTAKLIVSSQNTKGKKVHNPSFKMINKRKRKLTKKVSEINLQLPKESAQVGTFKETMPTHSSKDLVPSVKSENKQDLQNKYISVCLPDNQIDVKLLHAYKNSATSKMSDKTESQQNVPLNKNLLALTAPGGSSLESPNKQDSKYISVHLPNDENDENDSVISKMSGEIESQSKFPLNKNEVALQSLGGNEMKKYVSNYLQDKEIEVGKMYIYRNSQTSKASDKTESNLQEVTTKVLTGNEIDKFVSKLLSENETPVQKIHKSQNDQLIKVNSNELLNTNSSTSEHYGEVNPLKIAAPIKSSRKNDVVSSEINKFELQTTEDSVKHLQRDTSKENIKIPYPTEKELNIYTPKYMMDNQLDHLFTKYLLKRQSGKIFDKAAENLSFTDLRVSTDADHKEKYIPTRSKSSLGQIEPMTPIVECQLRASGKTSNNTVLYSTEIRNSKTETAADETTANKSEIKTRDKRQNGGLQTETKRSITNLRWSNSTVSFTTNRNRGKEAMINGKETRCGGNKRITEGEDKAEEKHLKNSKSNKGVKYAAKFKVVKGPEAKNRASESSSNGRKHSITDILTRNYSKSATSPPQTESGKNGKQGRPQEETSNQKNLAEVSYTKDKMLFPQQCQLTEESREKSTGENISDKAEIQEIYHNKNKSDAPKVHRGIKTEGADVEIVEEIEESLVAKKSVEKEVSAKNATAECNEEPIERDKGQPEKIYIEKELPLTYQHKKPDVNVRVTKFCGQVLVPPKKIAQVAFTPSIEEASTLNAKPENEAILSANYFDHFKDIEMSRATIKPPAMTTDDENLLPAVLTSEILMKKKESEVSEPKMSRSQILALRFQLLKKMYEEFSALPENNMYKTRSEGLSNVRIEQKKDNSLKKGSGSKDSDLLVVVVKTHNKDLDEKEICNSNVIIPLKNSRNQTELLIKKLENRERYEHQKDEKTLMMKMDHISKSEEKHPEHLKVIKQLKDKNDASNPNDPKGTTK